MKKKALQDLASGLYVRTCCFLEFRESWFIYVVVDLGMAGVVPEKEKVAYVWSGLAVLPERQAEPAQQNNP